MNRDSKLKGEVMNLSNRNAYSDPTANEAIQNIMTKENRKRLMAEINKKAEVRWLKSQKNGKRKILVY